MAQGGRTLQFESSCIVSQTALNRCDEPSSVYFFNKELINGHVRSDQ